jgi:hypothetical protein
MTEIIKNCGAFSFLHRFFQRFAQILLGPVQE